LTSMAQFNEPASHLDLTDALLERLTSVGGGLKAYRRDKAPTKGGDYVILDLLRTTGGNRRLGGGIAPSSWYATCSAVGDTLGNASTLLRKSTLALVGFEVVVEGVSSTAIDFDGSIEAAIEQAEYDLSLWSGSRTFTFAF
jgi:hypothetical protein